MSDPSGVCTTPGVRDVGEVRVRWIGYALRAECAVVVDPALTVVQAHEIAVGAEHRLLPDVRRLTAAFIHADPEGDEHHALMSHHLPERTAHVPEHPHAAGERPHHG